MGYYLLKTGLSTFPLEQHIFSRTVHDFSAEGHYSHELGTAYTRHRIAHRNTAQHFNSRMPFWLKRGQSLQRRTTQRNRTQRLQYNSEPCLAQSDPSRTHSWLIRTHVGSQNVCIRPGLEWIVANSLHIRSVPDSIGPHNGSKSGSVEPMSDPKRLHPTWIVMGWSQFNPYTSRARRNRTHIGSRSGSIEPMSDPKHLRPTWLGMDWIKFNPYPTRA